MQPLRDKGSVNWFGSDPHNSSIDVDCLLSVDVNGTKQVITELPITTSYHPGALFTSLTN
jgi:hypothetical protein